MTLIVHTARISSRDPDRLDITRASAGPDGIHFAPSWDILGPALAAMKRAARVARGGGDGVRQAEQIRASTWTRYAVDYRREMLESHREHFGAWRDLLARERVTLVCYCVDASRCHRTLLAGYLGRMGADVRGDVEQ